MTPVEPIRPEAPDPDEDEPPDSRPAARRRPALLAAVLPALLLPLDVPAPAAVPDGASPQSVDPRELQLMRMRAAPQAPPARLAWPSSDPVTSEFGPRWGRLHEGVDLDGDTGDPVTAAADGLVVEADYDGGYGLVITIRHSGPHRALTTAYAHLSSAAVTVGQRVERGERIGALGATGNAVGDHLHFEVRRGGTALDPRAFLEPRAVPAEG